MRSVASKLMWVRRADKALVLVLAIAATLATSLLVMAVATRPAEAAFLGASGKIVFSSNRAAPDGSRDDEIYVMNTDGIRFFATPLTDNTVNDIDPTFSSDGSRIAFSRAARIWLMNADGSGQTQFMSEPGSGGVEPTFSPDGSKIAFHREIGISSAIFVINLDGTGQTELFGGVSGIQTDPAFSPDGSRITFRSGHEILVGNANGSGTPINMTSNSASDVEPDWGPANLDLSLVQSDSPDPVKVNNNLTYTLEVTNEGLDAAPDVVLTDKLPDGVTFVSACAGCTRSIGKVTCKLGNVPGVFPQRSPASTVRKTITVTPTTAEIITNTASVESSAPELTYTANNSDRKRTEVSLNRAPVANDDSYGTREDTPLTEASPGVLSDDTDADGDTLTVASVPEPTSGGTLTHGPSGSFTFTPDNNFNGADAFTYKATDGTAQSNVATATIVVRAVDDPPNAADDSAQTEKDTPLDVNVLANDRDPERDDLSINNVSDPAHGTATLNGDGTVRYAPDTGYTGSDPFTYDVSDSTGGTDTATVNVTVSDTTAPDVPVITGPADGSYDNDGSVTLSGTAEPNTFVRIYDGGNYVNGAFSFVDGSGTWSVNVSEVSEGSHSYTATTTDLAQNASAASEARTVTVDMTAPEVEGGMPVGKKVLPTAKPTVTFSEAMDKGSVEAKNQSGMPTAIVLKKGSVQVAATVELDASKEKATLRPTKALKRGATYTVTVTGAAKDVAGNALDQDPNLPGEQAKAWTFTVRK